MSTVLISGGTGLVGKAIGQALLAKGYEVIILTRDAQKSFNTRSFLFNLGCRRPGDR